MSRLLCTRPLCLAFSPITSYLSSAVSSATDISFPIIDRQSSSHFYLASSQCPIRCRQLLRRQCPTFHPSIDPSIGPRCLRRLCRSIHQSRNSRRTGKRRHLRPRQRLWVYTTCTGLAYTTIQCRPRLECCPDRRWGVEATRRMLGCRPRARQGPAIHRKIHSTVLHHEQRRVWNQAFPWQ